MLTASNCKIWKTVKVGTGLRTSDDFRKALAEGKFVIGHTANIMLDATAEEGYAPAFCVSQTETEVDLVVATIEELGLGTRLPRCLNLCAKCSDVYPRIAERGFELCSAEVGPQLRLQFRDQPMAGVWQQPTPFHAVLTVAMTPLIGTERGNLFVFEVRRDAGGGGGELSQTSFHADEYWAANRRLVLVKPRK